MYSRVEHGQTCWIDSECKNCNRPVYSHYSATGASRIDRIYLSRDLMSKKGATEILPVAFTDHCAKVISVTMETVNRWRGKRHCRMNPLSLKEDELHTRLGNRWDN
jgi:hypothetical protein